MVKKIRHIRAIIEQLLEQTNNSSPPIRVRDIVKSLNISVQEVELGDIAGLVFREGNQVIIGVNSKDRETRRRFTIAHELGHFFLHSNNPLFVDKVFAVKLRDHVSSEAVDIEEIEANAFAAELLMPTKLLQKDFQEIQPGALDYEDWKEMDDVIQKLALKYEVSKQAMTIRLINLGVIPQNF